MNRFVIRSLLAAACAAGASALVVAQNVPPPPVALTVQPAAPVDVVMYGAGNNGTVLARTDAGGKATLDFLKLANAGKIGKVTVTEERCPAQSRLLLTTEDASLPAAQQDCRRRRAGAFVLGKDTAFTARLGNGAGMSTTTKAALIGGGAAAAAVAVAASSGGGGNGGGSNNTGGGGSGGGSTGGGGGGGVDLTALFGTFNISATKTTDTGCNFNQTFTGQFQVAANKDGSSATYKLIERLTRAYSGTVSSNGTYAGTGTGNLDGFIYNGTIAGQISSTGSSVTGTETLNFTAGCPGKMVIYQFTGNK